jgi:hypothetical protein
MQGGSRRVVARLRLRPVDYEGNDRDGGLMGERIENVDNGDVSARRRGKLRNGALDAARAPVTIAARTARPKRSRTLTYRRGDVGNGFGSRKRRNTFSVMRDTLLS